MKELKYIIKQRADEIGGMAAIARKLNWGSEKHPTALIKKYISGSWPSLEFAIKWKETFDENLIDMIFEETAPIVYEPEGQYVTLKDELNECRKDLIDCMKTKDRLQEENARLKNFRDTGEKLNR